MADSKKRRKILIFIVIGLAILSLAAVAIFRKREVVITVQTEKVGRRTITELVVANGKVQPVIQVKISPEVSGEIIELPVKEGQHVNKGDLILKIKPDFYVANRNQAEAAYKSSAAGLTTSEANLAKALAEFKRNQELFDRKLISDSLFMEFKTLFDVAKAQALSAKHQVEMSKASLARSEEELSKTTIVSPLTGTVSKLNSQLGERVVGTATMAGTDVMIIADLNEMEARVDVGEVDVVLIKSGQKVRLEIDAFKDRKFNGVVTEIANSSRSSGLNVQTTTQEATKFEVRILISEKDPFRPGMSVTAEIETRYRTNVLAVPIASVTTRSPKSKEAKDKVSTVLAENDCDTNSIASTNLSSTNAVPATAKSATSAEEKKKENAKPIEVVFIKNGDRAKMLPVKIGISDDTHWEILEGLQEGQEIISGTYRAIRSELEDGKKIRKGKVKMEQNPEGKDQDKTEKS